MDNRTMFEKMRGTRLPDYYYAGMHKEGYSPYEILTAARSTFYSEQEEEDEETEAPLNVHIQSEVKTK